MSLAYAVINTVPDKMEAVFEKIKEIKGVEEAYMVYGVYDIIAEVKARNVVDLRLKVLNIRKLEHVTSTLSLLIVS